MPTPPKFTPPRDTDIPTPNFRGKWRGPQGIAWLVALIILGILGIYVRQNFHVVSEEQKQEDCLTNMKRVSLAFLQYAQDNDDRFPEAGRWMTVTRPYIKDARSYHCPDALDSDFGYAYNNALSRLDINTPKSPTTLVLNYDSTATTANASDHVASLPSPGRHNNYFNTVSFADGHAKSVPHDVFSPSSASHATFSIDP